MADSRLGHRAKGVLPDQPEASDSVPAAILQAREMLGLPIPVRDLADELIRDRQEEAKHV